MKHVKSVLFYWLPALFQTTDCGMLRRPEQSTWPSNALTIEVPIRQGAILKPGPN